MFLIEPLLISWLIIHFQPLRSIFEYNKYKLIRKFFTCFKCNALQLTIIYQLIYLIINKEYLSLDLIYPAIINSIIGYVYERIENQYPIKSNH